MPRKLHRYHRRGDLHFVTFSCYERRTLLGRAYTRDLCLKILEQVRRKFQSRVVGYVVMPEHVHLLIGEPQRAALATLLQVLKQRVSRRMRGRKGSRLEGQSSFGFVNQRGIL